MRRLLGVLVIVLAACSPEITSTAGSGDPSTEPSTTASTGASEPPFPVGSEAPSVAPSPTSLPSPSTGPGTIPVLFPGSAVEVIVAELNLRDDPSTSARRIETFERGQVLIVSPYDRNWFGAGPVRKNGYTWYPVLSLEDPGPVVGWVATDNRVRPYVRSLPPRCPATVNLANVEAMLSADRLACFGEPIVLEGTFGCPVCGAELVGDFEPIWLNYPQSLDFLSLDAAVMIGPTVLRFPPGGPERPAGGSIIRVTVHVDDPAAAGCSIAIEGEAPVPAKTAVLYCREQLVVDSYDILGMDPDFGG